MSDTHAETVAFVRDTMLEQKAPPVTLIGPIGWARSNLFSGPFNTIVSLISIAFVAWVLSLILPWILSPTWNATSLSECREIVGGSHGGACWGVIRERWLQLVFGFYPSELYWRPILTFVLLLAALAPVLFTGVPKQMLWVSAAFPFVGPWLLWGGTFWMPLAAAFGFVLGYFVTRFAAKLTGPLIGMILGVAAALLWWAFLTVPVAQDLEGLISFGIRSVTSREFGGFMLSITIGVTAIGVSLPLGILLALGRQSDLFIVKSLCVGFIEFIRGVPLITLLFVASTLLNIFLPPGTTFDIILRVMIMVTLFAAAYMAEVVRGGLAALPKGQYEAADALGLDYWKAQRLIIMPQALKISIPGIVSTFIGVFKDTTLVSIIGLLDPLGLSNAIRADSAWNGIVWEIYGFIALMFFIFCFSMSRYSMFLERKLQTGHH